MTIKELYSNLSVVMSNFDKDRLRIHKKYEKEVLSLQKDQFWDGKNSDNEDLKPSYLDDSYFKSRKAAQNYANWKNNITPNSKRNRNTPNLFITGYFYKSLDITYKEADIIIGSNTNMGNDIEQKYKNLFGLTDENLYKIKVMAYTDYVLILKGKLKL